MKCAVGHCGHCQFGPTFVCRDGPVFPLGRSRAAASRCGSCDGAARKPKLAVWKFASCDGCQLSLLDCEDELLALAGRDRDRLLPRGDARPTVEGPYDLSLVEGSITTPEDAERIREVRRACRGAWSRSAPARPRAASRRCATSPTSRSSSSVVYATPEYISTLETSTPITAHVHGRLRAAGLPDQQAPAARGDQRLPERAPAARSPSHSVCIECKRRGNVCVMVAHGTPCLGPGHPRRLRRALPGLRPRLLRLLRADGDAEHRLARRLARAARRRRASTSCASTAPSTPSAEPFRERERGA